MRNLQTKYARFVALNMGDNPSLLPKVLLQLPLEGKLSPKVTEEVVQFLVKTRPFACTIHLVIPV